MEHRPQEKLKESALDAAAGDPALALAESAARAAGEGRIEEARKGFAQALRPDTTDLRVLFLGFQFHFRIGELDEAERLVRRRLALAGPEVDSEQTARAYTNLGLVLHHRGDLDGAERELSRALCISERLGHEYGIARDMGNLSLVPETRGDLDRAEELCRKALAIAQRIGADDIAATKFANLGDMASRRGRINEARELWTRAVELFERLGNAKHRIEFTQKLEALNVRRET